MCLKNQSTFHITQLQSVALLYSVELTPSSFFSNEDSFNRSTDQSNELEDPLEDASQEPLDIVGALNTLNLDAELNESSPVAPSSKKQENSGDLMGSKVPAYSGKQTASSVAEDRDQNPSVPPQRLLSQNILTPNPSSVATFGGIPNTLGNPGSTPSYGWGNNFLPFSAPPMAYPMSDPSSLQIPPFHLPEDHIGSGSPMNLGGPSNTNSTVNPQTLHNFGGILDSRFAFENFGSSGPDNFATPHYGKFSKGNVERNNQRSTSKTYNQNNGDSSFDKSEEESSKVKSSVHPQNYAGSNLWNQTQHPIPQFISPSPAENYLGNQFSQYGQMNMMTSPPNQLASPVFAENPSGFSGPRISHGDSSHHFIGNRRHHNHMNGGVNIHRKMHNSNRRKGEDASKYANAKLEDFTGEIYSLCKDQHGCRFLQRQLDLGNDPSLSENASNKDVAATMIFNELYLKIVELMIDPFGNYLIQKLFESVSADQRLILVKNAAPEFIRIALDPHGTRALQKLVECISTPEESMLIIESLSPHIVSLSRDLNGNHVVQKCLQRLKPEENQFIFDTASAHCGQIATHRHGCCVLQRCLDHGNAQQREQLSLKVAEIATNLSLDPFGNYVVQYVLTRGDEKSITKILNHISSHVVSLSLHKFGSNVIEKSLRINGLTDSVIEVLLKNQKQFSVMLNDPFGNYVLQTSLDVASASDLTKLANSLQPYLPNIKNTPHGRRILTKIQNIL
ncbi:hypothetical protein JCM33374_g4114 [Metschnikowia sp. JCM 33374]|nr:hypothetical protein JCM33374_g4114 [Metschnikowia sp. JCM 33374]